VISLDLFILVLKEYGVLFIYIALVGGLAGILVFGLIKLIDFVLAKIFKRVKNSNNLTEYEVLNNKLDKIIVLLSDNNKAEDL